MSDAGRWAQVTAVFQDALERDEPARASYLDAACAGDGALRAEVESLLAAHQAAGRFAEGSPLEALAPSAVEAFGIDTRLIPGSHLGAYEIAAPLGAGGMGEVYRARDATLNRDVAVKVLPDLVAHDSDRLARFTREAQILAALNHPNIVTVHSVEEDRGVHFITMELVKGTTLAEILPRDGFALDRFFDIAIPLADAVAAAHAQGIVHRDLKPANVMVSAESRVKVLDFGLAKLTIGAAGDLTASNVSEAGAVVGTHGYLSPEQARGQVVDARSDIFALGIILYEMLTGRRPFVGATPTDVLSAVIRDDPPAVSSLRAGLPRELSRVVRRCLAKDPARRLQSALDLRNELEDLRQERDSGELRSEVKPVASVVGRGRAIWPTAVVIGLLGWAAGTFFPARSDIVATDPPIRFVVQPPPGVRLGVAYVPTFDISADGRQLLYMGSETASTFRLFLRRLDRFETTSLLGTDGALSPVFSPEGDWVAFARDRSIYKMRPGDHSSLIQIADTMSIVHDVIWPTPDVMFFAARGQPIRTVSPRGGEPTAVTTVQAETEIDHHTPTLLPGGDVLLFGVRGQRNRFSIAAQALRSGARKTIIESGFAPRYSPTGHLLFGRGSTVLAVPFDVNRLEVTGAPVSLLTQVANEPNSGVGAFRLSANGTLIFEPRRSLDGRRLIWVDRSGNETPLPLEARAFATARVSPDGRHIAFTAEDGDRGDIWTYEISTGKLARVTLDGNNWGPAWTRDGAGVVYATERADSSEVLLQHLDGSAPVTLGSSVNTLWPTVGFSVDQKKLLVVEQPPSDNFFISQLTLDTGGRPEPLVTGPGLPTNARLSPDGRWLAYVADQLRRTEVFLQKYPVAAEGPRQVTVGGGYVPVWRRDGKELFYRSRGRMFAVPIDTSHDLVWGTPTPLFDSNHVVVYDVGPDGRFLMIRPAPEERSPSQVNVVVNWVSELLNRAPLRR